MVLESIVVPQRWEKHPFRMFFIGFAYSVVGLLLADFVFTDSKSIAAIFLTSMPLIVIMYKAIVFEEHRDFKGICELDRMRGHLPLFSFFLHMFLGVVASYLLFSTVLPHQYFQLFSYQRNLIGLVSDQAAAGAASSAYSDFAVIFKNNMIVLAFCILFSFLYGSGAVFILILNASILGVAIGDIITAAAGYLSRFEGGSHLTHYIAVAPTGFVFLVHGLPEMLGYFIGALAGGMISVSLVCGHFRSPSFRGVLKDAFILTSLSVFVIFVSAAIEVYLTPNMI